LGPPWAVEGQHDDELGELAALGVDRQAAAVLLDDDVVTDGEAEAGALPGRLGREEGLEDTRPHLVGEAVAVVSNPELDRAVARRARPDREASDPVGASLAVVGGVAGVVRDVEERAHQVLRHRVDQAGGRIEVEIQADLEIRVEGAHPVVRQIDGVAQERVDVGRLPLLLLARGAPRVQQHAADDAVGPDAVLLDLRQVELQLIENVGHVAGDLRIERGALELEVLPQLAGQLAGEIGEVVDEVERVLDLVRDACGQRAERPIFSCRTICSCACFIPRASLQRGVLSCSSLVRAATVASRVSL
jgi:hypothetical protein